MDFTDGVRSHAIKGSSKEERRWVAKLQTNEVPVDERTFRDKAVSNTEVKSSRRPS